MQAPYISAHNSVSKADKLLARFSGIPADFTWDELVKLLAIFGFAETAKKGGSYRTFVSAKGLKMFLHKPHPENIVPRYALRQVLAKLREFGYLK